VKVMHTAIVLAGLAVAVGCSDPVANNTINQQVTGNLKFVNGYNGPVNVLVDGVPVMSNVALGAAAGADVGNGQHAIQLQPVGGSAGTSNLVTFGAANFTAFLVASTVSGQPQANFLLDTNAIVPAGATKLRVGNFAASAAVTPISIWRTQPDFQTPIRIQFPFPYQTTSPYLQSTTGDWRIMVSHEDNTGGSVPMPDTLANSGLISVPSGESRTVIVTDGATAGTFKIVVIDP
jgi:hypothetical protein